MIHNLKPYPAYKDSGVPWLGEVPEHWEMTRLRRVTQCLDGKRIPLNGPEREKMKGSYPYWGANKVIDHVNEWLFDEELVLLGEDGAPFLEQNRDVAFFVRGKIWVNNHAHVLRPKKVIGQYLSHALNCVDYVSFIDGATRDKLTQQAMKDIVIPSPGWDEQSAIARYLDHIDQRIRRYIRTKQKLIKLLEEQKQAIIHQAVTRGLDPNVKFKSSGVEWLGDVPEHWEVETLEGLADVVDPNPSHRNPIYVENGFPFISTVEFSGTDDLIVDTSRRVAEATVIEQEQRCKFRPDSIAFSRKGTIGAARILPHSMRFALLDSVCVINCGKKINHMFLYRQISSAVFTTQLGKLTRGAALKQVSVGRVRRLRVLVPPIHEQEAIVNYLEEQLPPLNSLVEAMKKSVKLLREYRTRLISDVVTGKLDVREAAENLSEEVEEIDDSLAEDGLEESEIEDDQAGELEEEILA